MTAFLLLVCSSPALKTVGLTRPAKLMHAVRAAYPQEARRQKVTGLVRLKIVVQRDGRVGEVEVVDGHTLLREAAQRAVKRWRYSPAMVNGERVAVPLEVAVRFPPA